MDTRPPSRLAQALGVEVPLLCGAMYPCSNPELVAAVSEAGGLGIVQPLSLVYVHGFEFRAGLARIRSLTARPIGLNVLTESSLSKVYRQRMEGYVEAALEAGVRFFVTALGNPRWVVERVHPQGGLVYHDVVDRRWADKAVAAAVAGLICVNSRAGGHAGRLGPEQLFAELQPLVTTFDDHPWAWAKQEEGTRTPQNSAGSRWNNGKDLSFTPLRPELVVEVRYEHMQGVRFRHTAQFNRWRPDRDPRSCTYEQLDEPVNYDLAEILALKS